MELVSCAWSFVRTRPAVATHQYRHSPKKQSKGRIVNLSSIAGLAAVPFESTYVCSKHALEVSNMSDATQSVRVAQHQHPHHNTPTTQTTPNSQHPQNLGQAFSTCIRAELQPWGIKVVTLCPTPHATPINAVALLGFERAFRGLDPGMREAYGEEYFKAVLRLGNTFFKGGCVRVVCLGLGFGACGVIRRFVHACVCIRVRDQSECQPTRPHTKTHANTPIPPPKQLGPRARRQQDRAGRDARGPHAAVPDRDGRPLRAHAAGADVCTHQGMGIRCFLLLCFASIHACTHAHNTTPRTHMYKQVHNSPLNFQFWFVMNTFFRKLVPAAVRKGQAGSDGDGASGAILPTTAPQPDGRSQ